MGGDRRAPRPPRRRPCARAPRALRGTHRAPRPRPSRSCARPTSSRPSPRSRSVCGISVDRLGAELGARDLEDHADDALPDLGRGAVHGGAAVGMEHDASGTGVVEALRVADVLEPDREADPAPARPRRGSCCPRRRAAGSGRAAAPRRSGTGIAAAARIVSATGHEPSITCPVGRTSPGPSAFSRRSSIGSIPSSAASRSICASAAKHVCTAPKPRIAPQGGLFV